MEEWPSASGIHEGKFFPKMTFDSQNQTHIAQQFRREKLRIPGSQPSISPQVDDENNHTSGSRSSSALPQRFPDPKRTKVVRDCSYPPKFESGMSGNHFQNSLSDACQAYSTGVVPEDSFNFQTGTEFLDVSARKMTPSMGLAGSAYSNQSLYSADIDIPSHFNRSSNPSNWGLGLHGQMSQHTPGSFFVGPGTRNFQNLLNNHNQASNQATVEALLVGTNMQNADATARDKDLVMEPYIISNNQSEALQLCGINVGYHGYPDNVEGNMVLIGRSPGGAMESQQSLGNHERNIGGIHVPMQALSHSLLAHQTPVAVIPVVEQPFPSNILSPRMESQASSNWPNGGNELLFLPLPEHTESNPAGTTSTNQTLDFGHTSLWSVSDLEMRHPLMMQRQGQTFIQGELGQSLRMERQEDPTPGHFQGLSLSLSSHQPSDMQLNPFPVQIANPALVSNTSLIPCAVEDTKVNLVDGFSNRFQVSMNTLQSPREILLTTDAQKDDRKDGSCARQFVYNPGVPMPRMLSTCKYLKVVQHLLDEICSVGKDGNSPGCSEYKHRDHMASKANPSGSIQNERADSDLVKKDGTGLNGTGTAAQSSEAVSVLTQEERQSFQIRKTQLLSMLQEVDRQYREYYEHMQAVIFLFDSSVGQVGAARPYTRLALKAMSRHFRCLRDTITNQIQIACKALGEEDMSDPGPLKKVKSRLRFVDQQLRQQRALQQLGMLQQPAWRPQRGLPEHSVSILRAWLFEHFLHPYPKDADKMLLARQTGLSRSQVSNWFINARVRLWKPMVEEMYLEENREHEHGVSAKQINHQADDSLSCEQGLCENRDVSGVSRSGIIHDETRNNEEIEFDGKGVTGSSRHCSGMDVIKPENESSLCRLKPLDIANDNPSIPTNLGTFEGGMDKETTADMPFKQSVFSYNANSLSSSLFDKSMQLRSKDPLSDALYHGDYKAGNLKRYSTTFPYSLANGNAFISQAAAPDAYALTDGNLNLYTQIDVAPNLFENGVSLTLGLHANNFTQPTAHHNYIHAVDNLTDSNAADEFQLDAINHSGVMHPDHIEGHESINFQNRKRLSNYSLHEFVA